MTVLSLLLSLNLSTASAEKICDCGAAGYEDKCCWEITEVTTNGKTEKVLTISPAIDPTTHKPYTNVTMKHFSYTSNSDNRYNGYTSNYKSSAPWARSDVTSVVVEYGINNIGGHAFLGETKLLDVYMPSVTTINGSAFYQAFSLTSVDIPNVTTIDDTAFYGATSLEYVGLRVDENGNPLGITIGENVFYNTKVSNCSATNRAACGSCGNDYIKSGLGCVSDCGAGYLGKEGRCISAANGCGENYKQIETWCNRIRYTPAEAAQILKDTDNEIIMTFKVNR